MRVLSSDPDRTSRPSGEKATEYTESLCPSNVRTRRPVSTSHTRTMRSSEPAATYWLVGDTDTDVIPSVGPFISSSPRVDSNLPESSDHNLAFLSPEPEIINCPDCEASTEYMSVLCPRSKCLTLRVFTSHTLTTWSSAPVTSHCPSGEKHTARTYESAVSGTAFAALGLGTLWLVGVPEPGMEVDGGEADGEESFENVAANCPVAELKI